MDLKGNELRLAQLNMLHILKQVDRICQNNNIRYWLDSGTLLGAVRHGGFIPWDDDLDICMPRKDYEKFLKIAQTHLPSNLFLQTSETDPKYKKRFAKVRLDNTLVVEDFEMDKEVGYHQGIYVDIFPMDFTNNYKRFFNFKKFIYCNFRAKHSQTRLNSFFFYLVNYFSNLIIKPIGRERWISWMKKWYSNPNKRYCVKGIETFFFSYIEVERLFPLTKIRFEDAYFPAPKDTEYCLRVMYGDYMQLPPEDQRHFHAHILEPIPLERN